MASTQLFRPLKVGAITVPHRVFMAPLTRLRSIEPGDIPTPLMAEYYRQRAGAGLIITEATQVSFQAKGYAGAPGLHTQEQIAAWKVINEGIHQAGGHSAVQLWHTGRISHNSVQPEGKAPVAPSAIPAGTRTSLRAEDGSVYREDTSMPRELSVSEIQQIVADFGQAAANAREADFDLLELHSAHGYLMHQFLSPSSNHRTDAYGGSVENRGRFALEVVDAAIANWSADRVGIRVSPVGSFRTWITVRTKKKMRCGLSLSWRNATSLICTCPNRTGQAARLTAMRFARKCGIPSRASSLVPAPTPSKSR